MTIYSTSGPGDGQALPDAPTPHRRAPRLRGVRTIVTITVILVAGGLVYLGARLIEAPTEDTPPTPELTRLEAAKRECAPGDPDIRLGDNGTSMQIYRAGAEERPGASFTQAFCILDELEIPDAVVAHIEGTRALDGRQEATWNGFTASWTYHPDDGLNLILREVP
ncbi:MAG UNVERIFIED_CONTAM: hypothetical protein LOD86_05625 [Thermobifida fusca]